MSMDIEKKNISETIETKMSKRLITIAGMLGSNGFKPRTVADVGCDHGYISIYLVQKDIAAYAIAMDVRKGPLSGAEANIQRVGLESRITTRLSDGLKELNKGEAEGLVSAGMGGKLMIRLLEEGNPLGLGIRQAVLQPQSEIAEFRQYLRDKNFQILEEKIVFEDGKYYFPMKVSFFPAEQDNSLLPKSGPSIIQLVTERFTGEFSVSSDEAHDICNRFGEYNIFNKDPLLKNFCEHGKKVMMPILDSLKDSGHNKRFTEVKKEYDELEKVLQYLE